MAARLVRGLEGQRREQDVRRSEKELDSSVMPSEHPSVRITKRNNSNEMAWGTSR